MTADNASPTSPVWHDITPPLARREAAGQTFHGVTLQDDYAWMRADNWQRVLSDPAALSADIREHLERENAYSATMLADTASLKAIITNELRGRIKEDDAEPPMPDGPWSYYTRFRAGGQYLLACRQPLAGGAERLLFDGDDAARGHAFFHINAAVHSPDHANLAWSVDDKGSEFAAIRVRDLASGHDGPDLIEQTDGAVVWMADSKSFLYVHLDDNHRPAKILRHVVGTRAEDDTLVLEENDPRWFMHLARSTSGRFGLVSMHDHDASEVWLIDLDDSAVSARLVSPRSFGRRYEVDHRGDTLLILTNADGAEDFKIVEAPLSATDHAHWHDLVAHRRGCMIIDIAVFANYIVRLERQDGLPRIVVRETTSSEEHAIVFDEAAYSLRIVDGYEFDTTTLRFVYSSMTTPAETFDYDMASRQRVLRKRREIPSGHNPADYVTRRLFARAADGALVPISLLARADLAKPAPCLLYGYGSYGHSIPAAFEANRFSLVDRGFVFAIAHIRGGTDKGWHWYEDGKLAHKPNSFSDFVAVAKHLIADGWTQKGRIVAQGGSAGGMLMGAVTNLAPDLFAGVIADVPFVDVMNTMLDATLPLTPPEWREWGNPIADETAFRTMLSYSPYDNVSAQWYPPILAIGGLTDPRVTYWEPAKWVARLRATMSGGGPVLLHTNMGAGHGGASGRFEQLAEVALEQTFALKATGYDLSAPERALSASRSSA